MNVFKKPVKCNVDGYLIPLNTGVSTTFLNCEALAEDNNSFLVRSEQIHGHSASSWYMSKACKNNNCLAVPKYATKLIGVATSENIDIHKVEKK